MNWKQVRNNWGTVGPSFHAKWDKLTDDDLESIAGKRHVLVSRLRKLYAMERKAAELATEDFIKTLS